MPSRRQNHEQIDALADRPYMARHGWIFDHCRLQAPPL
jgi:hypothetical protein